MLHLGETHMRLEFIDQRPCEGAVLLQEGVERLRDRLGQKLAGAGVEPCRSGQVHPRLRTSLESDQTRPIGRGVMLGPGTWASGESLDQLVKIAHGAPLNRLRPKGWLEDTLPDPVRKAGQAVPAEFGTLIPNEPLQPLNTQVDQPQQKRHGSGDDCDGAEHGEHRGTQDCGDGSGATRHHQGDDVDDKDEYGCDSGNPSKPCGDPANYVEGIAPDAAARLGTVVADPADATLAVVRLQAPWEHRDDLFLESWFHQGSLAFPPGLRWRLARIAEACPLIVDVFLDRPAVLSDLVDVADVLVADFGTNDHALVDALTGVVEPVGVLPFDLPRSMDDVRAHPEDRPGFDDPVFAAGWRC